MNGETNEDFGIRTSPAAPRPAPAKSRGCLFFLICVFILLVILGVIVFLLVVGISFISPAIPEMSSSFSSGVERFNEEFVKGSRRSGNKIALIDIEGVILNQPGSSIYTTANSAEIVKQLENAAGDEDVKAVLVRINSPGGEVVASDTIHHKIIELKNKRKIPVVACMDSLAASGGYYVAVACDRIIAHRMTITGSIGVIIQSYKYYELFKKVGLKTEVIKSGEMKDILDGATPTTEEERRIIQTIIDNTYDEFVKVVAQGRPALTVQDIKDSDIGDGRIFDGQQAFRLKLVDGLGYFDDAVTKAAELARIEDYKLIRYKKPFSLAQIFSQTRGAAGSLKIKLPGESTRKIELEKGKIYLLPPSW